MTYQLQRLGEHMLPSILGIFHVPVFYDPKATSTPVSGCWLYCMIYFISNIDGKARPHPNGASANNKLHPFLLK